MRSLRSYTQYFLNLLYPKLCLHCELEQAGSEDFLCIQCAAQYRETDYYRYPENAVERHFIGRIPIQGATVLLYYKKGYITQSIIHEFKYQAKKKIGQKLGHRLGTQIKESYFGKGIDGIVAIPLHPNKRRKRGFNQSDIIAKAVAEVLKVDYYPKALKRTIDTNSQTKKSRSARLQNVSNVFECENPLSHCKHLLVIDDVITTGATIESAVNAFAVTNPEQKYSIAALAMG